MFSYKKTYQRIYLALLFVLAVSGCNRPSLPGMPELHPAVLTVLQDGNPLENASVVLINIDTSSTWSAGGTTDANGNVQLRTMGKFKGIPEGTYSVAVSKIEFPQFEHPGDPPSGDAKAMKQYNEALKKYDDNKFFTVDPKYSVGNRELIVTISKKERQVSVDVGKPVHIKAPPSSGG